MCLPIALDDDVKYEGISIRNVLERLMRKPVQLFSCLAKGDRKARQISGMLRWSENSISLQPDKRRTQPRKNQTDRQQPMSDKRDNLEQQSGPSGQIGGILNGTLITFTPHLNRGRCVGFL
jgi:hypothetical protein